MEDNSQQNKEELMKRQLEEYRAHNIYLEQSLILANQRADQMAARYHALMDSKVGRLLSKLRNVKSRFGVVRQRHGRIYAILWLMKPSTWTIRIPDEQEMSPIQQNWIAEYLERIASIPDSNGCRYYEKVSKRIGLICDNFFYDSIVSASDFVFLTPDNWREELGNGLDAMLFVTAWRGLNLEWRGLGAVRDMEHQPMRLLAFELLDTCKDKGIPTIFYSKEDPPNYEVFLDYAKRCDYVCTTAQECIPKYIRDCGHDRVKAVSFGVNPTAHNPIGFRIAQKEKKVLFSGSWMLKYPDRCQELAMIFDGVLASDYELHVIDRNYPENLKYAFPAKYFPYASPALPHTLLQKVHKLFDWAININSVKGSRTMFANRAFELQANGVLLLSNLSVGVNEMLPTVQMIQQSSDVSRVLASMTEEACYERQIAGIRSVMTEHTCFQRVAELLEPVGLAVSQPERKILVLAEKLTEAVRTSFERQSYPNRELRQADEVTAEDLQGYDMVAWFDENAAYGVYYLEDMSNGFKYTACDYITKDAWYEGEILHEGTEHNYVIHMGSKYRTIFWREAFEAEFLLSVAGDQNLFNGYSIDHFNFNAAPVKRDESEKAYQISVIVPVKNNGLHLYGKAISSLRRSSLYKEMEILLVDAGSTEAHTVDILTDLELCNANVRVLHVEGDEELAIAEGIKAAAASYTAVLYPEDEAVGDGYAIMLRQAESQQANAVVGNLYSSDSDTHMVEQSMLSGESLADQLAAEPWRMESMVFNRESAAKLLKEGEGLASLGREASTIEKVAVVHYLSADTRVVLEPATIS